MPYDQEPFMEFALEQSPNLDPPSYTSPERVESSLMHSHPHDIIFKNVIFNYHISLGKINEIEKNPFSIEIPQGEKVLLL